MGESQLGKKVLAIRLTFVNPESLRAKSMIIDQIFQVAPPGTFIPKPIATGAFRVKGRGKRRGEDALVYFIPNHSDSRKPHQKGVTASEFERAHARLVAVGELTKEWFKKHLSKCDAEGSCNFTTVGGLFVLMGDAVFSRPGTYRKAS